MEEYKTVRQSATAEYEEKRSRFIAQCIPVTTEADAAAHIQRIKKENFGARHNVYAYMLKDGGLSRCSDDGEPHSTAGMPTLEVIRSAGVVDCLIVTTRYFGGVLLGTGGLVRAYTAAAKMSMEAAGIAVMKMCRICKITCDYPSYDRVVRLLADNGASVQNTEYGAAIAVAFSVPFDIFDGLCAKITDTFSGKLTCEVIKNDFSPF